MNTTRKLLGARGTARLAALVVVSAGFVACADAAQRAPTPAPEPVTTGTAELLPISQTFSPGEILGIEMALFDATALEASAGYYATDQRLLDLTNHIADVRIQMAADVAQITAQTGVAPVASPISRSIYAQSQRDFAYLRSVDHAALDDVYTGALVLSGVRTIGLSDRLLAPNTTGGPEWLYVFVHRARMETMDTLNVALTVQRSHSDWHLNVSEPKPVTPIAPQPGNAIPAPR